MHRTRGRDLVDHPITIGKYRILALLGEGGHARVFLALMRGLSSFNKLLVLKLIREDLDDPLMIESFLQEARLAAQLSHPNVVQTYEVGESDGQYFIAMEYVQGQSLTAIQRQLRPDAIPLAIHLRVLADTARALHHAHTLKSFDGTPLNIVHRDVSPHNVMATYDGQVKLLDFGIAKSKSATDLTRDGVIKGKIAYMAPEQLRCESVDHRADIFSLGVMMWQAITNLPFAGGPKVSELAKIQNRLEGKEPRLRNVAPGTPVRLVEICEKALAINPENRQATAEEFAEEISDYLAETSAGTGPRLLAELIGPLFARERMRIQGVIDEQVRLASNAANDEAVAIPRLRAIDPSHQTPGATDELQVSGQLIAPPPPQPAPRAPRWVAASIAGAMAVAGAAAAYVGASSSHDASAEVVPPVDPPPAAPQSSPPSPAGAPATPAPETVQLRITAVPIDAEATLDGARVTLPFEARVQRDTSIHVLAVSAPGFTSERRALTFDRDHEITVALEPESRPAAIPEERRIVRRVPASSAPAATPARSAEPEAPARASTESEAQPPAQSPAAPPPPAVLPATSGARRAIDLDNPYQ